MLELAEQVKKRTGSYPSGPQLVAWMGRLEFKWGGDNLFFCNYDASESLYHGEILESCRLTSVKTSV